MTNLRDIFHSNKGETDDECSLAEPAIPDVFRRTVLKSIGPTPHGSAVMLLLDMAFESYCMTWRTREVFVSSKCTKGLNSRPGEGALSATVVVVRHVFGQAILSERVLQALFPELRFCATLPHWLALFS